MANASIYAAFERMWTHINLKIRDYVSRDELSSNMENLASKTYVDNLVNESQKDKVSFEKEQEISDTQQKIAKNNIGVRTATDEEIRALFNA